MLRITGCEYVIGYFENGNESSGSTRSGISWSTAQEDPVSLSWLISQVKIITIG
jgi:hypothetical protein